MVESIANTLTNQLSNQAVDSAAMNKRKTVYTLAEAKEAGLNINREPPASETCKFCGKSLDYEGICLAGTIVVWRSLPQRCDCKRAVKYWQIQDAEADRKKQVEQEAEKLKDKQERINQLIGKSGIKKRFQSRTFENFQIMNENHKAYKIAKEYADNYAIYAADGKGLYFEGTYGTGKTHLAAAISLQLISQGIPCVCKTSIDIFADIKRTFDDEYGPSEFQVVQAYKEVNLLVIDDLGKEMATDWSMATLYDILNDRYETMRPTIITTNYNDQALIRRLTPKGEDSTNMGALMSRLKGSSKLVSMVWDDWRQK